jgi:hypothetical protein
METRKENSTVGTVRRMVTDFKYNMKPGWSNRVYPGVLFVSAANKGLTDLGVKKSEKE